MCKFVEAAVFATFAFAFAFFFVAPMIFLQKSTSLSLVVVVCFVLLPHDEREYSGLKDEKRASEVHLCCRRVLFSRRWTCSHPDDGRWVLSDTPRCCCFLPVRVVLVLVRRGETLRGCAREIRHHECERWNDDDDDDDSF